MTPEQIKQILEFYANAQNYEEKQKYITTQKGFGWVAESSTIQKDAGDKARKALSKLGGKHV